MPTTSKLDTFITRGFIIASFYNLFGSIFFSKFLTNDYLTSLDSETFSKIGWVSIFLWGLAYLSVAKKYQYVPYLVLVFFLEKVIYFTIWALWILKNRANLSSIYKTDFITGLFYSLYGMGDFFSALFFLWVALKFINKK